MKMTQVPEEQKKASDEGLNINARAWVPSFLTAQAQPTTMTSTAAPYQPPSATWQQQQQLGHDNEANANPNGDWEDYEVDPEAYEGEVGYYDENGNFVVDGGLYGDEDEDDDNNGMDSDEEQWMLEQVMKGEDEYDRVHGIVRNAEGVIVSGGAATESGNSNKENPSKLANEAHQFASRYVEEVEEEDGEGPEFE
eukprot:GILI01012387.1.p1 GENE.GILI01012387.1~~GILI01012387.1.p1  ORF type:complete len:195 (-),score=60.95 GILI01012387.1:148-732(-)